MSSIGNVQQSMQWQHPNHRNSCFNCGHVRVTQNRPGDKASGTAFRCDLGQFLTPRHAVCAKWQERTA